MGLNWKQKKYLQKNQDKASFIRPDSPFQPTQADPTDLYLLPKSPGHPVSPAQYHTGQALLELPHLTFVVALLSSYCLHLCPTSPSSNSFKILSGVGGLHTQPLLYFLEKKLIHLSQCQRNLPPKTQKFALTLKQQICSKEVLEPDEETESPKKRHRKGLKGSNHKWK